MIWEPCNWQWLLWSPHTLNGMRKPCNSQWLMVPHTLYGMWEPCNGVPIILYMWGSLLQVSHIPYNIWGTISHWQLQDWLIPYQVWGTIRVINSSHIPIKVWETIYHWQLQGSLIPFKVWETIRVIDPLQGSHIIHVGTPLQGSDIHIGYGGTIRVIDSCKVPTFLIKYGGT